MATEKRLIDVNYALQQIEIGELENGGTFPTESSCIKDFLNVLPTVDAVEVVRCKDCKHCKKYRNRLDPMLNHQLCVRMDNYAWGVEEDDFCSYGERKYDGSKA